MSWAAKSEFNRVLEKLLILWPAVKFSLLQRFRFRDQTFGTALQYILSLPFSTSAHFGFLRQQKKNTMLWHIGVFELNVLLASENGLGSASLDTKK